jgi:hypothetical protein
VLEQLYLPAQRRLGHAQAFGSAAEMQLFGDGDETVELSQVEDHV